MVTLAIDPAYSKAFAYALFQTKDLLLHGKERDLRNIVNIITIHRPDIIVTEDMYLGKNVDTLKKLCYSVGKIMYVCEGLGIPLRLISPGVWMAHHGLKNPSSRSLLRQYEDKIIETVTDEVPRDPDIRSAILIGMCHIEQTRIEAK
jgi:Holliday junction resolvasome RuvABC endonuclease subunit